MTYDSVYPTFRSGAENRNWLGRRVRESYPAAMPCLWTRFDHRPRTTTQAGARRASRLDQDPARSLPRLRKDLHLPSTDFSPLHPLQLADSMPSIAAALWGALLLGRGDTHAPRPWSRPRSLHAAAVVAGLGPFTARTFFSAPGARPRRSLAGRRRSGGSPGVAVAGSGFASPLAPPSL